MMDKDSGGYTAVTDELDIKIDEDAVDSTIPRQTAVARTQAEMAAGNWTPGRVNQAMAFVYAAPGQTLARFARTLGPGSYVVKRAQKSDAKRKQEKRSRKANRRRR
jgi:hypothetical protein